MCDFTAKRKYSAHEKSVPKPMMSYRTDSRGNIEPAPEIPGRECTKKTASERALLKLQGEAAIFTG